MDLRVLQGGLSGETDCGSDQNLVPHPFSRSSRCVHSVQKATADGPNGPANDPEYRHDTDLRECKSLCDGGKCEGNNQGEHSDTRSDRTGVLPALEVDREIVQCNEVGTTEEDLIKRACPHVAFKKLESY